MTASAPFEFPEPAEQGRNYREAVLATKRDAEALPTSGPIADLVAAIGAELTRCVAAGRASHETVPYLLPLGERASELTGSLRGMIAICWKAAELDPKRAEVRRDMIDKAWHGVRTPRGGWMA